MPRLTASERARLPSWAFALPERREFPLTDKFGNVDHGHITAAFGRILGSAKGLTAPERSRALSRAYAALRKFHHNDLQHLMRAARKAPR